MQSKNVDTYSTSSELLVCQGGLDPALVQYLKEQEAEHERIRTLFHDKSKVS